MKIRYFEKGFNYSQDGPGNRLVIHLSVCDMHCPWCANPEGMRIFGNENTVDAEDLVKEILSCKMMFFDGGGVTFTGGECTLQFEALFKVICALKSENINVAIESNANSDNFIKIAKLCDYIMLDYKSPLNSRLLDVTGGNLSVIENNITEILKTKTVHIRIPLIHGFNDDDESLNGFVDFFNKLKNTSDTFDVEILPYHEYGKEKWLKTGMEYKITNGFVPKATVDNFINIFKKNRISVINT